MINIDLLNKIKGDALNGVSAAIDDCLALADGVDFDSEAGGRWLDAICDAADEVRSHHCGNLMETCSIVNGKSGRCTENCKWCAQSAAHHTGCEEYDFIDGKDFDRAVELNGGYGVGRLSIVCSGRKVSANDIRRYCGLYEKARQESGMKLCASMGLLNKDDLQQLYDAGVTRYHCNLETSAAFFPKLCTSHTREDKLQTIRWAREVGMEVCSGGIIGMGETLRDRLEMAREALDAGAVSIPVNLLIPIKGTPLEHQPLIGEREAVLTVALMRFVAPKVTIRFAGGRARLSAGAVARMLRGGANGAIVGDMLTTIGNQLREDWKLFAECGFELEKPHDAAE